MEVTPKHCSHFKYLVYPCWFKECWSNGQAKSAKVAAHINHVFTTCLTLDCWPSSLCRIGLV